MPAHDVGVAFHDAEDDLIACLHAGHRPTIGDHIDAFGHNRVENDPILAGCTRKSRNDAAHAFVFVGQNVREALQTMMTLAYSCKQALEMAPITTCGFCAEAPLSGQTNGFQITCRDRIGKSPRIISASGIAGLTSKNSD